MSGITVSGLEVGHVANRFPAASLQQAVDNPSLKE